MLHEKVKKPPMRNNLTSSEQNPIGNADNKDNQKQSYQSKYVSEDKGIQTQVSLASLITEVQEEPYIPTKMFRESVPTRRYITAERHKKLRHIRQKVNCIENFNIKSRPDLTPEPPSGRRISQPSIEAQIFEQPLPKILRERALSTFRLSAPKEEFEHKSFQRFSKPKSARIITNPIVASPKRSSLSPITRVKPQKPAEPKSQPELKNIQPEVKTTVNIPTPILNKPLKLIRFSEKFLHNDINIIYNEPSFLPNEFSKNLFKEESRAALKREYSPLKTKAFYMPISTKSDLNGSLTERYISNHTPIKINFDSAYHTRDHDDFYDTSSLHQIVIRRGACITDSPDYISFKRTHIRLWPKIESIIRRLEEFLIEKVIPIAFVNCKKLVAIAESQLTYSIQDIIECLMYKHDRTKPSRGFGKYGGREGQLRAIIKIQSALRMYKAKKYAKRLVMIATKANIIQKQVRCFLARKRTLNKLSKAKEKMHKQFQNLQNDFQKNWDYISLKHRVEIHIDSMSSDEMYRISVENILQKQNINMARIFAASNPFVEIIYISPFQIGQEVLDYYDRIMELGGVNSANSRYKVICPDYANKFPTYFPTSRKLLYSAKTLKKLKELIKGKISYIVPGFPSADDVELAVKLNIPLLSGNPQKNYFYSTKSGSKDIFVEADLPFPSSIYNIYDEKEMVNSLVKLMTKNLHVDTWIFKIDTEVEGRGIATLNVSRIPGISDIRKSKTILGNELSTKIFSCVAPVISSRLRIAHPNIYRSYREYMKEFSKKGGIIEAAPNCLPSEVRASAITILIHPNGKIDFVGTYDKFFVKDYSTSGFLFPQKSVSDLNILAIVEKVGKILYQKGVYGFTSLDYIIFPDDNTPRYGSKHLGNRVFCAIDLKCYLQSYNLASLYFNFLMRGQFDLEIGKYTLNDLEGFTKGVESHNWSFKHTFDDPVERNEIKNEIAEIGKRCFVYVPFIFDSGLLNLQYTTFFNQCKSNLISFDLNSKVGTSFMLLDQLYSGMFGIISIGSKRRNILKSIIDALAFVLTKSSTNDKYQPNLDSREKKSNLIEVLGKLKLMYKKYENKVSKGSS